MANEWSKRGKRWRESQIEAMKHLFGEVIQVSAANILSQGGLNQTLTPKPPVKDKTPTEAEDQIKAVAKIRKMGIIVHHSPNGGYRTPVEASKFKRMGVSPGYPDLHIPYMRKGYGGLYIEVKRVSGGKLSENQLFWRDHLIKEGYCWKEAKGEQAILDIVLWYFK